MATILVVDDHASNREFLVTLLGYHQHRLLEAADGAEALEVICRDRPDLIITDILMPTMDGYELLRRLRADPTIASTPVILTSAYYLESEGRALASQCGIAHILQKPTEPEDVLRAVAEALSVSGGSVSSPEPEGFEHDHLRVLTDKLSQTNETLRGTNAKLAAIIELSQELAHQRNPTQLLNALTQAARQIIGARFAAVAIPGGSPGTLASFMSSGTDADTAAQLADALCHTPELETLTLERPALMLPKLGSTLRGDTAAVLAAAINSLKRSYGWLCLVGKIGHQEFSDEDQRLARLLAGQTGRIYENGKLYLDLQGYTRRLEGEIAERERAEQTLRASEQRFRSLIENASDLIAVLDAGGRLQYVSPSHERVLGYTPAELTGNHSLDPIHPDDRPAVQAQLDQIIAEPTATFAMEFRARHKNGSWCLLEAVAKNLLADPSVGGIIVNARDVTERRRAEQRTASLLQVAEDVSGSLDLDQVLQVQRRIAQVLPCDAVVTFLLDSEGGVLTPIAHHGVAEGLSASLDALRLPVESVFGGRVIPGRETVIVNDLNAVQSPVAETAVRYGAMALMMAPLQASGNPLGAIAACRVNNRRRSPFNAADADLLRGICRQLAIALEAIDLYRAQQEEAAVSSALAKVGQQLIASLGTPSLAEDLCELTATMVDCDCGYALLWSADDAAYVPTACYGDSAEQWESLRVLRLPRETLAPLLDTAPQVEVVELRTANASDDWAMVLQRHGLSVVLCVPLRRQKDVIGMLVAAYRDSNAGFTSAQHRIARGIAHLGSIAIENARLWTAIEEANRLKSDFVATMSHELRTPLNIIMGYNMLVLEEEFGGLIPEQREALQRVDKSARELLDLINNLLDLGRLEVGRERLEKADIALADLLNEVRVETSELPSKPGVEVIWRIDPQLPTFRSDAIKLKVVLKNLLSNAVKFTHTGQVRISARQHPDGIVIDVSDTGIGIKPEVMPFIFEAFRQGESAMTRTHGGIGLGLYIARRITDLLGATLSVDSTPGEGSRFRVLVRT